MTITTNQIRNYNPFLKKIDNAKSKFNLQANEVVSKDEKEFFAKLYPESKKEIIDYHFYHSNGKMSGVAIGSNLDRRG